MNTNLVVTYMDGGRRFFRLGPGNSWRWSPEDGTLVVGRALDRTMIPLSVIRHVDFEQVEAPDVIMEPDPVPLRSISGRWSSDAKNRYVVRLAGSCDDATVMELRDAWRRKLEAEGGQVVGSSIRTFQFWIEEDDGGGLHTVVAANAELRYRVDTNAAVVAIGTATRRDQLSGEDPVRQPQVLKAWWTGGDLFCVRLDGTIACSKLTIEELRRIWFRELESHGGQRTLKSYGTFMYRLEESESTITSVISGHAELDPGVRT